MLNNINRHNFGFLSFISKCWQKITLINKYFLKVIVSSYKLMLLTSVNNQYDTTNVEDWA